MNALMLSLFFLALPAAAQTAGGLRCEADPNNSKDPYAKMKRENEVKIRDGIRRMGITVGPILPRKEMIDGLNTHLGQLCTMKNTVESAAADITAGKPGLEAAEAGPQGCTAYQSLDAKVTSFKATNSAYQKGLADALKEQSGRYQKLIAEDHKALQAHFGKPRVNQSFRSAWGMMLGDRLTEEGKKNGLISNRLQQIEEEQKLNASRQEGYDSLASSIASLKEKCPSLIGDEHVKAGAERRKEGNWGDDEKKDQNETTGGELPPGGGTPDTNPGDGELIGPVKNDNGGGGIGEWASRNKGILLFGAGTAAVVGGVLWYKKEQDKKDKKWDKWANDQLNSSTATTTVTSTATSTSTGTSVSETTTLEIEGFPPSALANHVLPTIKVIVKGPNGQVSDSGLPVTISCVNSCTLTGTLTKSTAGGSVEFSDLYFTGPAEGVQLRVSAPGLNSVASPGSFSVIEATRQ